MIIKYECKHCGMRFDDSEKIKKHEEACRERIIVGRMVENQINSLLKTAQKSGTEICATGKGFYPIGISRVKFELLKGRDYENPQINLFQTDPLEDMLPLLDRMTDEGIEMVKNRIESLQKNKQ